jgi:hypothetical protein
MTDNPGQPNDQPSDQAKGRFLALQMMRLSGIALVVLGLLIVNGTIALPTIAGYGFLAVGFADALFLPPILARIWKSPPS